MRIRPHVLNLTVADRCRLNHIAELRGEPVEKIAGLIMRSSLSRVGSMNPEKKSARSRS